MCQVKLSRIDRVESDLVRPDVRPCKVDRIVDPRSRIGVQDEQDLRSVRTCQNVEKVTNSGIGQESDVSGTYYALFEIPL